LAEHLDALLMQDGWTTTAEFAQWVTRQRMSRRGRFIRVRFRTGMTVNLVPNGSLADGLTWTRSGWKFVRPNAEQLIDEFEAS
jgi:hypothetical protein